MWKRIRTLCRGGLYNLDDRLTMQPSQYGGQNAPLALDPSTQVSQALVPIEISYAIMLTRNDEQVKRASKRNCFEYEQTNAALETPSIYQDAMVSSHNKMWCDVIKTELPVLHEKVGMGNCGEISILKGDRNQVGVCKQAK